MAALCASNSSARRRSLMDYLRDRNLGPRTLRPERFELSEFQGRNPSVDQMTTCIDIDTTKDGSVC